MSNIHLVREYLDKPRYADMPSMSLAKILVTKHPGAWSTLDAARSTIRYMRNQRGALKRGYPRRNVKQYNRDSGSVSDGQDFCLPVPRWEDMKHHTLKARRVLVMSDLHIPYHHKDAIEIAVNDGLAFGANGLVILGDFWDFHRASGSFDPERGAATLADEIKDGRQGLEYLRSKFKRCELVFLRGNHDIRMDKFIYKRAEQLWGIPECTFEGITGLKGYGFDLVEENAKVMAGRLILLHGHEICRTKGQVNAARTLFLKAKCNSMIGHFHQPSHHTSTTLEEKLISCWGLGCLSTLHPKWGPYQPEWAHGYALIELDKDGNFQVFNKRIYKGKAW